MVFVFKKNIRKLNEIFAICYHSYKVFSKGYSDKLIALSVDITNRCTLRCKHCYWWRQEHRYELSDAEWISLIKRLKEQNPLILQAVWLGGEPLLRADLLEKLFSFFKFNSVLTNGTIPFPRWKNISFVVSVDGIEEDNDKIRGKGVYQRVRSNILKNRDLDLHLDCTLNKINFRNIDRFVEEWVETGIKGINFTFHTPQKGKKDEFTLLPKERDEALERIIALKDKYGSFIYGAKSQYKLMKSAICEKATSWCRQHYPQMGLCLDSAGRPKVPCVFAGDVDCSDCGCPLPYILQAVRERDLEAIISLIRYR